MWKYSPFQRSQLIYWLGSWTRHRSSNSTEKIHSWPWLTKSSQSACKKVLAVRHPECMDCCVGEARGWDFIMSCPSCGPTYSDKITVVGGCIYYGNSQACEYCGADRAQDDQNYYCTDGINRDCTAENCICK